MMFTQREHMGALDLIAFILENLNRRKGRVALTAVGVIIGTAAVVVLVSLAIGLQRNATQQLWGIGDLSLIQVSPGYNETMIGGSGPQARNVEPQITPITPDTLGQFAAIPGVVSVIPREWVYGPTILVANRQEAWTNMFGVGASDLSDLGLTAAVGTTQLGRGTVVIGANVPMNFMDPNIRPGQEPSSPPDIMNTPVKLVVIKWAEEGESRREYPVRVAGILQEKGGEPDWTVYMPMSDVEGFNEWITGTRVNRVRDGYQNVIVRADDPRRALDIAAVIKEMGFQAYAEQETVQSLNNFFLILQVIFGGVGAIALLVAAIGIANTMTMAVLERTREIGLLKAIGATNRDVLGVFLGEAAGIGLVGGIGGVALGWSAGQVINVLAVAYLAGQSAQTGGPPPSVAVVTPLWLPIFALVFATLIGLLSGLYPALRAATLIPVDALKYE